MHCRAIVLHQTIWSMSDSYLSSEIISTKYALDGDGPLSIEDRTNLGVYLDRLKEERRRRGAGTTDGPVFPTLCIIS